MQFGAGAIQSRTSLLDPDRLSLPYTVGMTAPLLFRTIFENVLMLGLGGGSLLRFYHRLLPECRFTIIERSQTMVRVAGRYFEAPTRDSRVTVRTADARTAVAVEPKAYDLVIVDVFDDQGLPDWVLQPEFCRDCHQCLAEGGVLLANLWVDPFRACERAIEPLIREYHGQSLEFQPAQSTNLVVLAFDTLPQPLSLAAAKTRARDLHERTGEDTVDVLRRIAEANRHRTDLFVD